MISTFHIARTTGRCSVHSPSWQSVSHSQIPTLYEQILIYVVGYNIVALDHVISGQVPANITNQIPSPLPFSVPASLQVLRRCTVHLSDPSQNHRLNSISSVYDLVALRPTTEKCLMLACQAFECDLISLDLSIRYPFYFKHKTLAVALQRGIKLEICYGPGVLSTDGGASRRNLISNATQLIRATRGRGIIMSSEARRALACRGPADVINMAVLWGLGQERGVEAVGREARSVVMQAEMRRRSYGGVIDVVYGGEKHEPSVLEGKAAKVKPPKGKRKAEVMENQGEEVGNSPKPISKREQKRQAKKARLENAKAEESQAKDVPAEAVTVEGDSHTELITNGDFG